MPDETQTTNLYSEVAVPRSPLKTPTRVLAIGAHPDDIEFGAGGTVAKWAAAGAAITMLIVTDGSKGTWDSDIEPHALVATRIAEQEAAARALGAVSIRHLDHVDGELEYSMDFRKEMCRLIRETKPDVVISHDPWQRYQLHPDHRATGWAVLDGVVSARDHLFFPEQQLEAHRPSAVLLWSADEPDHWESISESFDTKIDALLCHSSQGTTTMGGAEQSQESRQEFIAKVRTWAQKQGTPVGLEAAESFKRITP